MQPEQPNLPITPMQSNNSPAPRPKGRKKVIVLVVLLVVTVLLTGAAGYLLVTEKSEHSKTSSELQKTKTELQSQVTQLSEANRQIELTKYQDSIRAALQPDTNRECHKTKSSILFNITTSTEKHSDGTVKKRFGVAQYICNNGNDPGSDPIRFAVVQSYDNGKTWQFTYGSSTANPDLLLNYIYDTDPALFKTVYNNPNHY